MEGSRERAAPQKAGGGSCELEKSVMLFPGFCDAGGLPSICKFNVCCDIFFFVFTLLPNFYFFFLKETTQLQALSPLCFSGQFILWEQVPCGQRAPHADSLSPAGQGWPVSG